MADPTVAAVEFITRYPDWTIVLDDNGNVQMLIAPGYEYVPGEEPPKEGNEGPSSSEPA